MSEIKLKEITRTLRRAQTPCEKIFWEAVRNRRVKGKKFIRQFAIPCECDGLKRFFVADFYCSESRLVVELDGSVHDDREEYDELRTVVINQLGIRVIRFRNDEIEKDLPDVIKKLEMSL
jgi:very-short-patch-repair endonuclease